MLFGACGGGIQSGGVGIMPEEYCGSKTTYLRAHAGDSCGAERLHGKGLFLLRAAEALLKPTGALVHVAEIAIPGHVVPDHSRVALGMTRGSESDGCFVFRARVGQRRMGRIKREKRRLSVKVVIESPHIIRRRGFLAGGRRRTHYKKKEGTNRMTMTK